MDFVNADYIVLYGCNQAWASPGTYTYAFDEAKQAGTQFVYVGPEFNPTAAHFHAKWIRVRPGTDTAPPWESVYRDNKCVVMTATTLGVRNAYKAHGFIPQRYPHVPDDHLALELDFIAALTAEALQACQAGDIDAASKHEADAVQFTHDHLSAWAPFFAEDVRDKGKAPLYATVAQTMAAFVEATVR